MSFKHVLNFTWFAYRSIIIINIFFYFIFFNINVYFILFLSILLKRTLDLNDKDEIQPYIELWKKGFLVSQDRDFPKFESRKEQLTPGPEVLKNQVNGLVRRFKVNLFIIIYLFHYYLWALFYFVVYLFVCFLFKIYFILFVFFHYNTILFFIIVLFFKFLYPILLLFFCSESIFLHS